MSHLEANTEHAIVFELERFPLALGAHHRRFSHDRVVGWRLTRSVAAEMSRVTFEGETRNVVKMLFDDSSRRPRRVSVFFEYPQNVFWTMRSWEELCNRTYKIIASSIQPISCQGTA
ncbi:hypothetical protein KM043_006338 [Ampulex compressa]|nr:hypothetical protein KM043_006338 [Ampulex compressa]